MKTFGIKNINDTLLKIKAAQLDSLQADVCYNLKTEEVSAYTRVPCAPSLWDYDNYDLLFLGTIEENEEVTQSTLVDMVLDALFE